MRKNLEIMLRIEVKNIAGVDPIRQPKMDWGELSFLRKYNNFNQSEIFCSGAGFTEKE